MYPPFCNNFFQQEDRDVRSVSIHRVGQCTTFTTFHFTPSGWLGNCMSKIILLFEITFFSGKIETWDLCPSIELGQCTTFTTFPFYPSGWLGNACPKLSSFCNNFFQQEDRDVRSVSIHRVGSSGKTFTTFHFTSSGWLGNCMSKIILLFVITFFSRKIETWDQCPSIEWDSYIFHNLPFYPYLLEKWIACPKLSFFL